MKGVTKKNGSYWGNGRLKTLSPSPLLSNVSITFSVLLIVFLTSSSSPVNGDETTTIIGNKVKPEIVLSSSSSNSTTEGEERGLFHPFILPIVPIYGYGLSLCYFVIQVVLAAVAVAAVAVVVGSLGGLGGAAVPLFLAILYIYFWDHPKHLSEKDKGIGLSLVLGGHDQGHGHDDGPHHYGDHHGGWGDDDDDD